MKGLSYGGDANWTDPDLFVSTRGSKVPARQGSEKWPSFYERVIKFCERSLVLAGATTASRGLSQTCHISRDLNYFFTAIDRIRSWEHTMGWKQ